MIEKEILQTLQTALLSAVAASIAPKIPIKMMLRTWDEATQAPDGKYWEVVHIPNNPDNEYWGEERSYRGIFRLILHWPNRDSGAYSPLDVVNSVGSWFHKLRQLQYVKIYDNPDLTGIIEAGNAVLFPVDIPYRSYQPTP